MKHLLISLCAALAAAPSFALASNACETPTLSTKAAVTTSYGSAYGVETYYRSPDEAVARFVTDTPALMAVEGPLVWVESADGAALAGDNERRFVIGHQFLALAFYFDAIMTAVEPVKNIDFKGGKFKGRKGAYPGGGNATLVADREGRPLGLLLELPDETRIEVDYSDWRDTASGKPAPHAATILHNGNAFNYRYTDVSFGEGDAVNFHKTYLAPAIDDIQIYRLHRALLAAHCRGDAAMMAALTAPEAVVANRGDIARVTNKETETRFASVFSRVDYRAYTDLKPPEIAVAQSGDLGWAVVNVRAEGEAVETGEPFSDQWAWTILARKIDGIWLNAGNASNRKEE